jgi:DNA primase
MQSSSWVASRTLGNHPGEYSQVKSEPGGLRRAQQVLLAIIINHPDIFDDVGETLGNYSFADGRMDKLRQELISVLLKNTDLKSNDVKNTLRKRGFSESLDFLFNDDLIKSNRVIQTDASVEKFRQLWEENVVLLKNLEITPELDKIRRSGETSIFEEDEDHWERQRALLEEAMPGCRD